MGNESNTQRGGNVNVAICISLYLNKLTIRKARGNLEKIPIILKEMLWKIELTEEETVNCKVCLASYISL